MLSLTLHHRDTRYRKWWYANLKLVCKLSTNTQEEAEEEEEEEGEEGEEEEPTKTH